MYLKTDFFYGSEHKKISFFNFNKKNILRVLEFPNYR